MPDRLWFKIFNLVEFNATGLVSRSFTYNLTGKGIKTFLVTKGNLVSITHEGIMLSIGLNEKNPFEFEGHAIYLDENDDVFWGFPI